MTALRNREKAVIIDALKNKYSLPVLLQKLNLSRSSYYYQRKQLTSSDKYAALRIHISEKIVRRIMAECGLKVKFKRKIKYNSYKGEIMPAGKVYLSPIVDYFDGMLPAWKISLTPDAMLVNNMLDDAVRTLGKTEHLLIHADRGCHYRWPGWISRMETAGLERSMSRKGCSPDNSACEGLFGCIKNKMFYNRNWNGISIPCFIEILNNYLICYNEKRIKTSLGNMSLLEYQRNFGLVV